MGGIGREKKLLLLYQCRYKYNTQKSEEISNSKKSGIFIHSRLGTLGLCTCISSQLLLQRNKIHNVLKNTDFNKKEKKSKFDEKNIKISWIVR